MICLGSKRELKQTYRRVLKKIGYNSEGLNFQRQKRGAGMKHGYTRDFRKEQDLWVHERNRQRDLLPSAGKRLDNIPKTDSAHFHEIEPKSSLR